MEPSKYTYFSFNRVQKCSEINHMNPHNLAMVFSSCLFQTKGQTSEEVNVIEDLIKNYVQLFDVGIFIESSLTALLLDMLKYRNLKVRDGLVFIILSEELQGCWTLIQWTWLIACFKFHFLDSLVCVGIAIFIGLLWDIIFQNGARFSCWHCWQS